MGPSTCVALLAEGVDRNPDHAGGQGLSVVSPSSRRAWIEICLQSCHNGIIKVALLAEGVDRNGYSGFRAWFRVMSPSSRRAWIEIAQNDTKLPPRSVALLAEGVDRNKTDNALYFVEHSRPPRGGRG